MPLLGQPRALVKRECWLPYKINETSYLSLFRVGNIRQLGPCQDMPFDQILYLVKNNKEVLLAED